MRIIGLKSENVKRLTAIDITPEGAVITVGGVNGAGKSSVLDSIAYALGGQALIPSEPIRTGETEAKITVNLGDYVITRKFKRGQVIDHGPKYVNGINRIPDHVCDDTCKVTFGPTNSTLVITNADGTAKYASPQAILDKLLGKLTFDPEAFKRMDAKAQNELLRRLCGISTVEVDTKRGRAVVARLDLKRETTSLVSIVDAAPRHPGVPAEEISDTEINGVLADASEAEKTAAAAKSNALIAKQKAEKTSIEMNHLELVIEDLKAKLKAAEEKLGHLGQVWGADMLEVKRFDELEKLAVAAVPDVTAVQARLTEIRDTNKKVRDNLAYATNKAKLDDLIKKLNEADATVKRLDAEKTRMLTEAKFPVAGLGLTDDGVTWNGLPFEQACTSEQLRVSVAIGLALNPTLKVLLIRNGNALDKKSMRALAEQAAAADAQVWCEYVTEEDDDTSGISVLIEDGHVR